MNQTEGTFDKECNTLIPGLSLEFGVNQMMWSYH